MGKHETVYVVDDDRKGLSSLSRLVASREFEVREFQSPDRFLEAVGSESVGCVVTDFRMPGMNGRQLQQQLTSAAPALNVIVVSAHMDVATTVELMSHGAVTVLEKPCDVALLLSAVQEACLKSVMRHARLCQSRDLRRRCGTLTEEEGEIAREMIKGTPIKALARSFGISMRTVDRRRRSILSKMNADSVGELATLYFGTPVSPEAGVHQELRVDEPESGLLPEMHRPPVPNAPAAVSGDVSAAPGG